MNKQSRDWLSLAEYDLQTARAMFDTGRYPGKINELAKAMDKNKAVHYLDKTQGV